MGTHPIFESDFDCLTDPYFNGNATIDDRDWREDAESSKGDRGGIAPSTGQSVSRNGRLHGRGWQPRVIQACMENAQRPVVNVQNKLDKVVSSFGQAMQAGMQKCQADAQQMMASGGVESDAEQRYMQCAGNVATDQLATFSSMKAQVDQILYNVMH